MRILLFRLHLIFESQFGSVLQVLLIGFKVIFCVLPTWDKQRNSFYKTKQNNHKNKTKLNTTQHKTKQTNHKEHIYNPLNESTFSFPLDLCYWLAEVHMNPPVIDEHVVHFEVSLLTVFLLTRYKVQIKMLCSTFFWNILIEKGRFKKHQNKWTASWPPAELLTSLYNISNTSKTSH